MNPSELYLRDYKKKREKNEGKNYHQTGIKSQPKTRVELVSMLRPTLSLSWLSIACVASVSAHRGAYEDFFDFWPRENWGERKKARAVKNRSSLRILLVCAETLATQARLSSVVMIFFCCFHKTCFVARIACNSAMYKCICSIFYKKAKLSINHWLLNSDC